MTAQENVTLCLLAFYYSLGYNQWRRQPWAKGAKPPKCRLAPTIKHTGQKCAKFSNFYH